MHFSIIHVLLFVCVLLGLPVQGQPQCAILGPIFTQASSCCNKVSNATIEETVVGCIEQKKDSFASCKIHAYIFITESNRRFCVDPRASWLQEVLEDLENREIKCKVMLKVNKAM